LPDPRQILVAGDTHGNIGWMCHLADLAAKLEPGDGNPRVILQLGDFGVGFLKAWEWAALEQALAGADAELVFIDGNHDDHEALAAWPRTARDTGLAPGCTRIRHIPRGHRWTWHGREWLACGGAASPDRWLREQWMAGGSAPCWWPGEYITDDDVQRCAGKADVLVCHDRPARARISLAPWRPEWTEEDHARCEASRDRVQEICDAARPQWIFHGHYHQRFSCETHDLGYGPVAVSQLGMDGTADGVRVLDIEQMRWVAVD